MDEQIKKYLYDIHEAISSIFSYLGEKRDSIFTLITRCCAEPWRGNLKSLGRQ